jgi:hypothetical protein
MSEPDFPGKSYVVSKQSVWNAWLKVKKNGGAASTLSWNSDELGRDRIGEGGLSCLLPTYVRRPNARC